MRRIVVLTVGIGLVAASSVPVVAQDEELRMGDDPAYVERFEVPEAGVAVSFPAGWEASVEMEYGQREPGDPYSGYWDVVRGSDDVSDSSCSLDWELYPGPSMLEIAGYGDELRASGDLDEESLDLPLYDVSAVELPAGAAARARIDEPVSGDTLVTYEIDHDGTRYSLMCFAETPPPDEWLDIAETIELLPADARLELPLEPPTEARVMLTAGTYELERLELPEVGIAMRLPVDWELDVMAEERELPLPPDYLDDGPMTFLQAFYAEGPMGDWCSLQIHPEATFDVHQHGDLQAAIWVDGAPAGMHVVNTLDFIADDLARHVDIINESNPGVARALVFDVDGVRHVLTCGSSIGVSRSWREMAGSIELLESPAGNASARVLEPVEVPEAGVSISLPSGWDVEVELEYDENVPGDPATGFWRVLYAEGDGTWCDLTRNLAPVGELAGLAATTADNLVEHYGDDAAALTEPVELNAGPAWRMGVSLPDDAGFIVGYYIDPPAGHLDEPSRFTLVCQSAERDDAAWLDVADSLAWLDGALDAPGEEDLTDADAHGLERVELADAGVSLALPPDWSVELTLEEREDALPDAFADAGPITFWALLHAEAPDGEWCELEYHPQNPMPLHDHASWDLAQWSAAFPDVSIDLYSAEDEGRERYIVVARGDGTDQGANLYFFESAGERYQLNCTGVFGPDSPWDAIATSVEPLGSPVEPAKVVVRTEVSDVVTELPVSGADEGETYMHAECATAAWLELADGTFREELECRLTDDPVGDQGRLPAATVTIGGGECEWVSDFWPAYDGSEVYADSWSVTVEPDGSATAVSTYGAEELACED